MKSSEIKEILILCYEVFIIEYLEIQYYINFMYNKNHYLKFFPNSFWISHGSLLSQ